MIFMKELKDNKYKLDYSNGYLIKMTKCMLKVEVQ